MKLQSDNKKKHRDLFIVIIIFAILILYAYYEANHRKERNIPKQEYIQNPIFNGLDVR